MVVYRYLSKRELDAFVEGDMESVGAEYYESEKRFSNTHKYKEGVKYLHFFQSLGDLKHIAKVRDQNKEHFVAQFDIPIMTLIRCAGKGYYETSGYDVSFESVREYAIPVEDIRPSFLDGYVSAKSIDTGNNLDISKSMEKPFIMPQESSLVSLIDVVQDQ